MKYEMNKVFNMDCLEAMKTMPDDYFDLLITDPPYKTTSRGSSGGTGGMLKAKINMTGKVFNYNDIKPSEWLPECYRTLKPMSHAYIMSNNKNLKLFLNEIEKAKFKIFKILPWVKNTCITNMYYMDTHEFVIFARKGKAKKINNCSSKSVLYYDNPRNKIHPTQKPVKLMQDLIENSTEKNDIVFDPFMGYASTAIAAINSKRKYIGCEIDKHWYDLLTNRLNKHMSQQSIFDIGVER